MILNHNNDSRILSLADMAQRELGAFMSAVTEVYGSEEAIRSADDWLKEFEATHQPPNLRTRYWRQITIVAAEQLANRLSAEAVTQNP